MQTVTIHDAKTNLSRYISAAKQGKKVFIGGFGKPEVVLTQVTFSDLAQAKTRDFSRAKQKITLTPESFSHATEQLVQNLIVGHAE